MRHVFAYRLRRHAPSTCARQQAQNEINGDVAMFIAMQRCVASLLQARLWEGWGKMATIASF